MQKIPIDLAKPGMTLAKPVTKENGITIMAEDMELTESLISRLQSMKIDRISVRGTPVDMGGAGAGTHWGERKERLDHLFRKHTRDKWMMRVKDRMGQYFQIKAAAQEAREKAAKMAMLAVEEEQEAEGEEA